MSKFGEDSPKPAPTGRARSLANLRPAWEAGKSGNPAGRPKGSRTKLGEDFLAAMVADFEQHGPPAIVKVREERPHEYLKIIAGILPKELNVKTNAVEELSDDELAAAIAVLQSIVGAQDAEGGSEETTRH